MVVAPLTLNFQVRQGRTLCCLPTAVRAFLAPTQHALLASQCSLRGAIKARVLNRMPVAIRQERFESDINTDIRMMTLSRSMLCLGDSLTDDEGVPVVVSTQDKMHGFSRPFKGSVQLDFERFAHLFGNHEVLFVLMQIGIFHIVSVEWSAIGCLA